MSGGPGPAEQSGQAGQGGQAGPGPGPAGTGPAGARVVIVGGGFGGLFAARALRRGPASVTLIDLGQHHLFQPLLYQCATGILSEGQITSPLRRVLRKHKNVECVLAEVTAIDATARRVLCRRPLGEQLEYGYDYLIIAAGVSQSYFGHDEFASWAPGMKSIADALTIRRRVFGAFEMAETATDPADQRHWLTFALVGAGPTGVELAGQIRELATKTLRAEFHRARPEDTRVLLFDGGDAPLASFGPKLSEKAARTLQALGTADPQDLKAIAPWPELDDVAGGDPDELQGQGYGAPPYHPGCRGMLSLVDEEQVQVPATEGEDNGTLGTESDSDGIDAFAWDDGAIQQLGWDRFNVTDPEVFSDVDEAFEAGDYDHAQALIDDWKSKNVEKEDQFDGPNAPKKKRRNQTPAGRTMDHDDIRADSSSPAFDSGVSNDANAPLET